MTAKPPPVPDSITEAYWSALSAGRLKFQRCSRCRKAWLPPSPACPSCWSSASSLEACSGQARLLTWATYHRAYHPAFADSLPYTVALVELAEGPRLMAGLRCDDAGRLREGDALTLSLEAREGGFQVPVFDLAATNSKRGENDGD